MNFRNSVGTEVIDRLYALAGQLEKSNSNMAIWGNKYNPDRVPFYRMLPANTHELWDLYTYRFMGLDPNIAAHHQWHHWLFDPKWSLFAANSHNLAYRIYFLLSEFDVPHLTVENRIDWRRLHNLFPMYQVQDSASSFAYWCSRYRPAEVVLEIEEVSHVLV